MVMKTLYAGASGINNVVDPLRLKFDPKTGIADLRSAINVDIDDTGAVGRRKKLVLIEAGSFHSLWGDGTKGFVAKDRTDDEAIYSISADLALTGIRDTMTKAAKVSFTQADTKVFYMNGHESGVLSESGGAWSSSAWPGYDQLGFDTVRQFTRLTVGDICAVVNQRMWVANGRWIRVSEENAYGKYRGTHYLPFETDVRMIKRVAGGAWVSDSKATYFIQNSLTFEGYQRLPRSPFPAHKYSAIHDLLDLSVLEIPGLSAVWSSDAGLCIGTEDGRLIVITDKKLIYPAGTTGATVVDAKRNVINIVGTQFITRTNLNINASSNYSTALNINSAGRIGDTLLFATDTGLYKLADIGAERVDALFTLLPSDHGSTKPKGISNIYVGVSKCDGDLELTITGDGKTTVGPYQINGKPDEAYQRRRADTGKGFQYTYGAITVSNVGGANFLINSIEANIDEHKHSNR